ncbi:MAG: YihY/virulence factor BrkB family protein [Balneolaceae bacterium]|nr:YihY/virulence factor BrkB family protein [Balneolaceae bacterium]
MADNLLATINSLSKETFKSTKTHDIALHGAAIAFYTIFSIAPLIIIVLGLVTFFLGEQQSAEVVTGYLVELVGAPTANSLLEFATISHAESTGIIASGMAILILLYGATKIIAQLKDTLNTIWGITNPRISSVKQYLLNRFLAISTIFLLTGLFILSLLLEGGLNFFSDLFMPYLPGVLVPLLQFVSSLVSILMTMLFFTLVFKILPDVNARWKDIFVGACVTTILFLAGKYLVGLYLGSGMLHAGYKAAGSFVVFLIWIYYNVQIVLIGAEFTQVYTKRLGKNLRASWNAEFISFK